MFMQSYRPFSIFLLRFLFKFEEQLWKKQRRYEYNSFFGNKVIGQKQQFTGEKYCPKVVKFFVIPVWLSDSLPN